MDTIEEPDERPGVRPAFGACMECSALPRRAVWLGAPRAAPSRAIDDPREEPVALEPKKVSRDSAAGAFAR
jgi:hypothetical protein